MVNRPSPKGDQQSWSFRKHHLGDLQGRKSSCSKNIHKEGQEEIRSIYGIAYESTFSAWKKRKVAGAILKHERTGTACSVKMPFANNYSLCKEI
jgi:hypothetical protein